jgi:Flp pilus assembly pilin Flp
MLRLVLAGIVCLLAIVIPVIVMSLGVIAAIDWIRTGRVGRRPYLPGTARGVEVEHDGVRVRLPRPRKPVADRVRDRGASAVEYALMVASVAAVLVGTIVGVGYVVRGQFEIVNSRIADCQPVTPGCGNPPAPVDTDPGDDGGETDDGDDGGDGGDADPPAPPGE